MQSADCGIAIRADLLFNRPDRNPHYPGLKRVLATFMDRYVAAEKPREIKILDLAAGSGEATEVSARCRISETRPWNSQVDAP